MLKKLFWIAVFGTSAALALSLSLHKVASQDPGSNPSSLQTIAQETIARGDTEVYIDNNVMFEGVSDINEALSRFTIVEVTAVSKKSLELGASNIGTWYKFSLNSMIRQNPLAQCGECASIPSPPADMAPSGGEISVLHPAGTVLVSGVSIFEGVPDFPDFQLNQKYLLFINYDATRQVAIVNVGPPGVYIVGYNGDLSPVFTEDSPNPIEAGLLAQYGNNLYALKSALNPVPIDTQSFYRISSQNSGKCLDVEYGSVNNGANLMQHSCHDGSNQKFRFSPLGNGYYNIIAGNSGKCLDVANASLATNARIMQYDCHSGTNQQWVLNTDPSGNIFIRARHSGKVMDIQGASYAENAALIQHDYHGGLNQRFQLSLTSSPPPPPPPPTCDPFEEQSCYNRGGSWDGLSCYCMEPDPCYNNPWNCNQY